MSDPDPVNGTTYRWVRQAFCHCGQPLREVQVSIDPGPPPAAKFSGVCGAGHSTTGIEQKLVLFESPPCRQPS